MHTPNASDHTVRWKIMGLVVGEQTVFDKLRFWVKQKPQSLTTEQLAFGCVLFVVLVRASVTGATGVLVQICDDVSDGRRRCRRGSRLIGGHGRA